MPHTQSSVALRASGMGMGAAATSKKTKKGKNKGKKKSSATPFDASASLLRLEKRYDELALASAKALQASDQNVYRNDDDTVTTEYMVAARSSTRTTAAVADWVPVAQLCIARPQHAAEASDGVSDGSVQAAVSQYCREIFYAATQGAPVFRSIARNEMQYSVETMDSFHKHVYEAVVEERKETERTTDETMTKNEARQVLKVDDNEQEASVIKRAYRSRSFELHPDRFVDSDKTSDEVDAASDQYHRVKLAYETLTSGVRGGSSSPQSWYESLGGRARTDFKGPVSLLSLDSAKERMARSSMESAVIGIDPEIVQTFVARNQAASFQ